MKKTIKILSELAPLPLLYFVHQETGFTTTLFILLTYAAVRTNAHFQSKLNEVYNEILSNIVDVLKIDSLKEKLNQIPKYENPPPAPSKKTYGWYSGFNYEIIGKQNKTIRITPGSYINLLNQEVQIPYTAIQALTNESFYIYIDNKEVIHSLEKPKGEIILLYLCDYVDEVKTYKIIDLRGKVQND